MLRQTRIEFPGAFYHTRVRGNRREPIFLSGDDHRLFLKTLGEPAAKHGWNIHVSPLMPNHQHLAAETPEPNLIPAMTRLQSTYTSLFGSEANPPPDKDRLTAHHRR